MNILAVMNLDIFRLSIGWALESLGHRVYYLENVEEGSLAEAVRQYQPDMLLDVGWDIWHASYVSGAMERQRELIKRHRLFHVYFAEEDGLHFDYWSKNYCAVMQPDFVLTRGKDCVPKYAELGIDAAYFDVGFNPEFHRPVPASLAFACDVSVLVNGQFFWDIYRKKSIADLVVPLFDQSYDVRIWGRDWEQAANYFGKSPRPQQLRGRLGYEFTPLVYNSAKINISVQSVEYQLSNRTYDILGSGGFLLTSDTPAVRELLRPGIDCEVSGAPEETLEKIEFYLRNDGARERIAREGLRIARERFAYQVTLPAIWPRVEQARQNFLSRGVTS